MNKLVMLGVHRSVRAVSVIAHGGVGCTVAADTARVADSLNGLPFVRDSYACWRRLNLDHLCRLNFDQGLLPAF